MAKCAAVLLTAALLPAGVVSADGAAKGGFSGELELVLDGALFTGDQPSKSPASLIVQIGADDGKWGRGFGMALGYNNGLHGAYVTEAKVDGESVRVELVVDVGGDNWVPGGEAAYTVELKRGEGEAISGTFTGTFKGQKVAGVASGRLRPPRPVRIAGFKPLDPAEHPRILFRKADLPALREKLKTPFGKAYLAKARAATAKPAKAPAKPAKPAGRDEDDDEPQEAADDSRDIVSLGMLYQLTGEKRYADEARKVVQGYGNDLQHHGFGTGGVGHRLVALVMTWDLCHDAWPAEFRKKLEGPLMSTVGTQQERLAVAGANFHPCSNYYGPATGSAAVATLLLYGEKGPEPKKPLSPEEVMTSGDIATRLRIRSEGLDKYKAEYVGKLARWRVEHREWARAGGGDLGKLRLFNVGRQQMLRHYRLGIGDGGFQAETGGYADIGSRYPVVYAAAYLKMFGRDLSPYPDATYLVPRRMMQVLFRQDGRCVVQKINSAVGFRPEWCAAAFPAAPEAYKPALLWAWNFTCGVRGAETLGNLFRGSGLDMAHTFVNYPLEMAPVHPSKCMPLTWRADGFGYYCFRSGWQGKDEFIAQVFLKAQPVGGWNHPNGGTFRIYGLGHPWVGGVDVRAGFRPQENVVLLPEDVTNEGACGRLAYLQAEPDGSGVMTIDMNDIYATGKFYVKARRITGSGRPEPVAVDPKRLGEVTGSYSKAALYDRNGIRLPQNFGDSGIRGLRAMAFDYSGLCGAPAMMVLVDKIEGGGKRQWLWQIPEGMKDNFKVDPGGRSFTADCGDASMKATFVAPADVKIEAGTDPVRLGSVGTKYSFVGHVDRVRAAGDGSFFLVATFQRGSAAALKVEGTGLGAAVTVGRRTIRFDGEKVVLGEQGAAGREGAE